MMYTPRQIKRWAWRRIRDLLSPSGISETPVQQTDAEGDQGIGSDDEPTIEPTPEKRYLAICGIMKNEAQNVLEWIAYHKALGVGKFYLYDNNSTDNIFEKLAPLVAQGLVEYTPWPINPGQLEAYDDCIDRHRDEWHWMAFIDLDEFILPFGYNSIPEWLINFESHSGVALQWQNFGPSNNDIPPPGLLIENYLYRLPDHFGVHGHVKTIVKTADFVRAVSPHAMHVTGTIVDEYRIPVILDGLEYSIQPVQPHKDVCINHYYTRSRAEWIEKTNRGVADGDQKTNPRNMAWIDIYEEHATVFDGRILRFADATRNELDRLHTM